MMNVGFEKIFLMYNQGTYETADVIATYIYRRGILGMEYSYTTAVGVFNSVVNFALLFTANYLTKKSGETGLW
jgi:putative aldouronate transport system permease protein